MSTYVSNITSAVKALAVFALLVGFALALVAKQTPTVDLITAPAKPTVNSQVLAQASEGRTCSTKPVLTDTIVVLSMSGQTSIMTFDKAYAAAKAGTVTVVTYCK